MQMRGRRCAHLRAPCVPSTRGPDTAAKTPSDEPSSTSTTVADTSAATSSRWVHLDVALRHPERWEQCVVFRQWWEGVTTDLEFRMFVVDGEPRATEGFQAEALTELALEFVERQDSPWFLVVSHKAPHVPLTPAPDQSGALDGVEVQIGRAHG